MSTAALEIMGVIVAVMGKPLKAPANISTSVNSYLVRGEEAIAGFGKFQSRLCLRVACPASV